MSLALAALQGAVFGIVAMRAADSESLRFALYGAIAFPTLSWALGARWPRVATALGLGLVALWTATCGAMAHRDPTLEAWEWTPGFALLGLVFGAGANAYLFRSDEEERPDPVSRTAERAPSPPPSRPDKTTDPWTVLGVAPGAPRQAIVQAFRARMAEYHPDKVATLGAELRELAEAKSREITAAYAALSGR